MDDLWQDIRYGLRTLRKSPGASVVVVLSLAIAIGANTTMFSVVNGILLRPLPIEDPSRVVFLYTSDFSGPRYGDSGYADFLDLRHETRTLAALVAYRATAVSLEREGTAVRLAAELVDGEYFRTLGLRPVSGRAILPADDLPGAEPVAVISHGLWRRQFGADPGIVGRVVRLNGETFEVVGIGPEGYTGLFRGHVVDFWMPIEQLQRAVPGAPDRLNRGNRSFLLAGRLAPGATLEAARAEFDVLAGQFAAAYPAEWTDVRGDTRKITVEPESRARVFPAFRDSVVMFLSLLMAVVGLVLLIACANAANILLARAARRGRETAVRQAMGASRGRLIRQWLVESLLLAVLAAGAGAIAALWGVELLMAALPSVPFPVALDLSPDVRVFAFTLGLALLTALLCGLAPALTASRADVVTALKEVGASGPVTRGRRGLRHAFVVVQVTLSLVLLIGAGLFVRSLANAAAVDTGFDSPGVRLLSVDLRLHSYTEESGRQFYRELLERVRALPGVEAAGWATSLPLDLHSSRRGITAEGYEPAPGEDMGIHIATVAEGYFEALRIPLVRGRAFTEDDRAGAPLVTVVNEAFARHFWPNQDPIGRRIAMGVFRGQDAPPQRDWYEVVGVVRDGMYVRLGEEGRPFFFLSLDQAYRSSATLVVRAADSSANLAGAMEAELRRLDPTLPVIENKTMDEHLGLALFPARLAGGVFGGFGAMALLLAALGVYGVMAYAVAQRTREIGIRVALGAGRGEVLRLVLAQGMRLVLAGIVLGLAGALGLTGAVRSLLFGVSPADPLTFAGVAALLAAVSLVACWIPARRAARVDPMVALRHE